MVRISIVIGFLVGSFALAGDAHAEYEYFEKVPVDPVFVVPSESLQNPDWHPVVSCYPESTCPEEGTLLSFEREPLDESHTRIRVRVDAGTHFIIPGRGGDQFQAVTNWSEDTREVFDLFELFEPRYPEDQASPEDINLHFYSWGRVSGRSSVRIEWATNRADFDRGAREIRYIPTYHYYTFLAGTDVPLDAEDIYFQIVSMHPSGKDGALRAARIHRDLAAGSEEMIPISPAQEASLPVRPAAPLVNAPPDLAKESANTAVPRHCDQVRHEKKSCWLFLGAFFFAAQLLSMLGLRVVGIGPRLRQRLDSWSVPQVIAIGCVLTAAAFTSLGAAIVGGIALAVSGQVRRAR